MDARRSPSGHSGFDHSSLIRHSGFVIRVFNMRFRLNENNIPLLATALVCVSLFAAGAVRYPSGFFTARNVIDMLAGNAFLGVVAVGMTFVILSGGIDLSVGSVVALTGVGNGWAVREKGMH